MSLDLTNKRWLRRIIKNSFFPAVLQWLTLAAFAFLILMGWNYHRIRGIDLPDPLAYTNINTLFFWVIWLMGLILLVPFIGRLWCTVCPLGYLNDLLARFGFRLRYPRYLKNLYMAAVLLIFYNGLVALFKINRYPDYSSRLLIGITALLLLVGVIFRGRIFCGYLCPIGAMVGIYSRVSPWRLDVRDRDVCQSCESKACYRGEEKWYKLSSPFADISFPLKRPGCQVELFPPELTDDPRCVMCTQCIKNCPYDNIRWGTRPFLKGVVSPSIPDMSEAVFMVFLIGTTISMFTRVWPALNSRIAAPGNVLVSALGLPGTAAGQIIHIIWGYTVFPIIVVSLLAALTFVLARSSLKPLPEDPSGKKGPLISFGIRNREEKMKAKLEGWRGRKLKIRGIFSVFSLSFIPLVLSGHAAFAMVKLNEKISYLPGSLRDPAGVKFYQAIHKMGFMAAPGELVPLGTIRWLALLMVVAGAAASIYSAGKLAANIYRDEQPYRRWGGGVFSVANAALGLIMAILIIKWLF